MTDVLKKIGYWDGSTASGLKVLVDTVPDHQSELYAPVYALVPDIRHKDDVAIDEFAEVMKTRMAEARSKGRCGWDDKSACTDQSLAEALIVNLVSAHPHAYEDIANFAMMLHQRGASVESIKHAVDILKVYIPKDL